MSALVIAILMPVFAAADQAVKGDVYEITPVAGGESYFAIIEDTTEDPLLLRIYYKEGSNPGIRETVKKSTIKFDLVGAEIANKAIERRQNKVSQVINGVRVPNDVAERAKQARDKALELESRLALPDPQPIDPSTESASEPVDPGPLAFRGPQIGLILAAVVLIAIIVKLVIIG
jgi:hypothetical protein